MVLPFLLLCEILPFPKTRPRPLGQRGPNSVFMRWELRANDDDDLRSRPKNRVQLCEIGSHFLELPLPVLVFFLFPSLVIFCCYLQLFLRCCFTFSCRKDNTEYRKPSYFPWLGLDLVVPVGYWLNRLWWFSWLSLAWDAIIVASCTAPRPRDPLGLAVGWSLPWMPWPSWWWWRDWVALSEVRNAVSQSIGHSFNMAALWEIWYCNQF